MRHKAYKRQYMENGDKTCMYCKVNMNLAERYIVQEATKPQGMPHRFSRIGVCCTDCEISGKPTTIDEFNDRL